MTAYLIPICLLTKVDTSTMSRHVSNPHARASKCLNRYNDVTSRGLAIHLQKYIWVSDLEYFKLELSDALFESNEKVEQNLLMRWSFELGHLLFAIFFMAKWWTVPVLRSTKRSLVIFWPLVITYHHASIPLRVRQRCTNVHPQFARMFRSHVIGGEPIAINRAQILTPNCYWEFHRKTQYTFCSTWESNQDL